VLVPKSCRSIWRTKRRTIRRFLKENSVSLGENRVWRSKIGKPVRGTHWPPHEDAGARRRTDGHEVPRSGLGAYTECRRIAAISEAQISSAPFWRSSTTQSSRRH